MTEHNTYVHPQLPQDKVRISASYRTATDTVAVAVAGMPETVEIELNDDVVPADPAERIAFLTSLVDSLFRIPADQGSYLVDISHAGAGGDLAQVRELVAEAKGGKR